MSDSSSVLTDQELHNQGGQQELPDEGEQDEYLQPAPAWTGVVMMILYVLSLAMLALFAVSVAVEDKFEREDQFHPGAIALRTRHFKHWNRQFIDTRCIESTVTGEGLLKDHCQFYVPYNAIFAGLCASFFGLASVVFYARDVMNYPRGNLKMHETAEIIHKAAKAFLHQEYTFLLPFRRRPLHLPLLCHRLRRARQDPLHQHFLPLRGWSFGSVRVHGNARGHTGQLPYSCCLLLVKDSGA
eukprot:Sspe_Gene.55595::Locus_30566_Transcript_1_1_Confidence_1.000_Length_2039::g.55595::m.55595